MVYRVGELVWSLAGHDTGSPYLILEESDGRLKLADGKTRTVNRPKLKNKKHVQLAHAHLPKVSEKIAAGSVTDADLVYAIRVLKGECNVESRCN